MKPGRVLLSLALAFAVVSPARATVIITGASGGSAISSDSASVGGSGTWTTLGPITIAEGSKGDIANGTGITLILKAPAGFEFNPNSTPSISFTTGDLTGVGVVVTDGSTLTLTLTNSGTGSRDTITIGSTGLQVRPTLGGPLATGKHIYRPTVGGGTATINGLTTSTDGSTGSNFGTLTEVAGAFVQLQLLMPGESNAPGQPNGKLGSPNPQTAGTAFNATVNGVDANWNLVSTADGAGFTIHLALSDTNATPPVDANLASGTQMFSVTFTTAGISTITASDVDDGTKTPSTSPPTVVNVGVFTRLQVLAPGESAAPGSATGKAGTPNAQTAGVGLSLLVNAVDANWNLINTNDTVAITSSDANAALPPSAALSGGSASFNITFKTAGADTVTATNLTHSAITSGTSSAIPVNATGYAKVQLLMPGETAAPGSPSGKTGTPSAQTAGTAFTVTANAVDAYWNVVSSVTDLAGITTSDANAILPANAPFSGGTRAFSLTLITAGNRTVTATDLIDGTKTPSTSPLTTVNPAAASKLVIATQPPGSAVAGTAFAQQPVVLIEDNFNNVRSNDTLVVTATPSAGILLGTTNITTVNGAATFTNLAPTAATNITIQFSNGALAPATSANISVSAGPFSRLLALLPGETNAPGTPTGRIGTPSVTAGSNTVVRVNATDTYFNPLSTVSDVISVTTSDTNTVSPANAALVNGTNSFNLTFKTAGSQTVFAKDVTDGSKGTNSDPVIVSAGPFVKLQLLTPGETAVPGTLTGKAGAPTAEVAATAFLVTVNGVDSNWNIIPGASGTGFAIQISSTDTNATLPANANLSSGTAIFSVALRTAGIATITATDASDGTKTPSTSPAIAVNKAPFSRLQVLLPGETAVAGSITGKTGTPTSQMAGGAFTATVNAVDVAFNLISTNDTAHISTTDTNAILPPDAALSGGTGTFGLTLKTAGGVTILASDVTHASILTGTNSALTLSPATYARPQVLLPGETAAPGSVTGKAGTPTARTAGTSFSTLTVNAVDNYWNLVGTNIIVAVTSSDPNAVLPANSALGANGTKTNFTFTFKTAGIQTITATDVSNATRTNTSSAVTVNPGALARLQLLAPGETPAPGTAAGKTGTPTSQRIGSPFNIIVNSVDANWNITNTTDTVHFTSSDPGATLPANGALVAGTKSFGVTLQTGGTNQTITVSDVTHTATTASTSAPIAVVLSPPLRGGPVVAIHDSEFTRALETITAGPATPSGPGTSGKEWWPTNWHYFAMPESLKEALRSDGTVFEVVGDADIIAGKLLDTNGQPKYPIFISLASEAIGNEEIAPLTNYVAAGGFALVGSSAFTRNTNGTTRGDFAFANELGIHMTVPGLTNWRANSTFTKLVDNRLSTHIPGGGFLYWEMPNCADEISWGAYPHPPNPFPSNAVWRVQAANATVVVVGDSSPCLLDKQYGKGHFIYDAAMQPLVGHGGWAPGMYTYVIFRKAIEWAFESAKQPVPRISPWPYKYDAALMVRHDLENYQNEIAAVEASAQIEFTNGVKGEYYFCTGTLREEMAGSYNTNTVIAGMRRAISNYNAIIGPHNGGLRNPYDNPPLNKPDFNYWHWGSDEALDITPSGYASGKAYALASLSNAFMDIEAWLPGQMTNGMRVWVAPYFNSTREDSYDIEAQLGVKVAGEQKLTVFPSWTISTATSGKRYPFLSLPVSEWFVGNTVSQSMEAGHNTNSVHALVDFYYNLGALINLYSHTLSTGLGQSGGLEPEYVAYSANTNLHPRLWPVNAEDLYNWSVLRSNVQIVATYYATNANQSLTVLSITNATDPNTAVEMVLPASGALSALQVFTNNTLAGSNAYRTNSQTLKILVGAAITNVQTRYLLNPLALPDTYAFTSGPVLSVPAPGVLANDQAGAAKGTLIAILVTGPTNGTLGLSTNGEFTYTPSAGFTGADSFTYKCNDGITDSAPVMVTMLDSNPVQFSDNFTRGSDPAPIAPWVLHAGVWSVTGGMMQSGTNTLFSYANVYLTNTWADYAVQARLQFPTNAFGGALGARLNAASGAHYAAWVYPENSVGGSKLLKLVRFSDWTTFTVLQSVSLAAVGTNWHTVKIACQGNQIAIWFDNTQVIAASDPSPFLSGGVSLDMWTDAAGYIMSADDVVVSPLAAPDSYSVNQNTTLTVNAPGVLANDSDPYGANLSAAVVRNPAHGTAALSANGGFTYTPAANYFGPDNFIYQANDGPTNIGTALVNITVNPTGSNAAPVIQSIVISNGVVRLTWSSIAGRTYRPEFRNSLTTGAWSNFPPDIIATGTTSSTTNAVNTAQRFYRIGLLP